MKTFSLSLTTPEKSVWEGQVDALIVPAVDGELGILPGHAPLLAQLAPGVVRIKTGDQTRLLAVSGGFVEVFEGRTSLFAETAEMAEEIDAERARQAAEKAKSALKGRVEALDAQAMAALQRAMIRLRVVEMAKLRGHGARTAETPLR